MTVAADPKRAPRYRASARAWVDIYAAFEDEPCVICGGSFDSLHHVYPRGQGGDDLVVNLVPVCGSGNTGCHGKLEARDLETRRILRRNLSPTTLAYLRYKLGETWEAWLDRRYPA